MRQLNDVVIFSLDRPDMPASDSQRAAIESLFDATPILGCYNGQVETSFLVDFGRLEAAKAIAKMFNQESILVVSDGARLVYLNDDSVQHIGDKLMQVDNVDGLDSYSIIDGKYYAVS